MRQIYRKPVFYPNRPQCLEVFTSPDKNVLLAAVIFEDHSIKDHLIEKWSIRPKTDRLKESSFDPVSLKYFSQVHRFLVQFFDFPPWKYPIIYLTLPLTLTGDCHDLHIWNMIWNLCSLEKYFKEIRSNELIFGQMDCFSFEWSSLEWPWEIGLQSNGSLPLSSPRRLHEKGLVWT